MILYRLIRSKPTRSLKNLNVVITGASSGIGRACAIELTTKGANLILCGRNREMLNKTKDDCTKIGNETFLEPECLFFDLSNEEETVSASKEIIEKTRGKIDVLICNAGLTCRKSTVQSTHVDVYRHLMNVNFFSNVLFIKSLLSKMISNGGAQVVGISSIQGKISIPERGPYAASKFAFEAFLDALRAEEGRNGIKVSVICPGYVRTPISHNAMLPDGSINQREDPNTNAGMEPEYVAREIVKAISDQNDSHILIGPLKHRLAVYIKHLLPGLIARKIRID